MNHPTHHRETYLPPQVLHATWIDANDKNALSEGMRSMTPHERANLERCCFHQQARGIFDMHRDDPVGYALLELLLQEDDVLHFPDQERLNERKHDLLKVAS